ncbi:MAG TPA: FecR family protein [Chloroflexota bacterium]
MQLAHAARRSRRQLIQDAAAIGIGLLLPLGGAATARPRVALAQGDGTSAVLETRQPDVQWSRAGAAGWQSVTDRQNVQAGDRVRTGRSASARIVYWEGSVVDVRADTGLIVQRLERGADGSLISQLFVAVGGVVSRVAALADSPANFQIDTPAATALVRGTQPRVEVTGNGITVIGNLPDHTGGLVDVTGKDPANTSVTVAPGLQTLVRPGQAPLEPYPINPGMQIRYCYGTYLCPR